MCILGVEFQSIVVYLIFHLYASSAQIAHEAAGIVLVNSNLTDLLVAIDLARTIYSRIRLNLMWALCYNSIGIPVAAGVLYPMTHEALPPYVAALAMALSSVSVLTSSLSLNRYKPPTFSAKKYGRDLRGGKLGIEKIGFTARGEQFDISVRCDDMLPGCQMAWSKTCNCIEAFGVCNCVGCSSCSSKMVKAQG